MKKIILKSALWMIGSMTFIACNRNEEIFPVQESENLNAGVISRYVDGYWSSTAVLTKSLPTAAETEFMATQMQNIADLWGRKAPVLKYVKDPVSPLSTYNAISYSSGKIYYGYAIYDDAKSRSSDNIVNVMILAHEYGHQLQYAYLLPSVSETTARSSELEADGFGGYYLRMPDGFNKDDFSQIAPAYDFAFEIGDNATKSYNHHGTPAQRRSAVRLGFLLGSAVVDAEITLSANYFDYYFFYYYEGVLNGTYKTAKQAVADKIDPSIAKFMDPYVNEIKRIQDGKMSTQEYYNLK